MKTRTFKNPRIALYAFVAGGAVLPAVPGAAQPTRPEEIVVTSSMIAQPRRQIGTAMSVIDFDDIELRGYTDLADVLRTQAGIGVSNSRWPWQAHVGPHPRGGELPHAAPHRRRQGVGSERAASRAELR